MMVDYIRTPTKRLEEKNIVTLLKQKMRFVQWLQRSNSAYRAWSGCVKRGSDTERGGRSHKNKQEEGLQRALHDVLFYRMIIDLLDKSKQIRIELSPEQTH
mmetsp:Transcript_17445/g.25630  ORF Transcript_17445/g.25630 Transcript_17445/m.25630 type:complete len:101 (-) Transcript_17445:16-318(-)